MMRDTLSVNVSTVYESDDDSDQEGLASSKGMGTFSKRCFVEQGQYRVGWLLDTERISW